MDGRAERERKQMPFNQYGQRNAHRRPDQAAWAANVQIFLDVGANPRASFHQNTHAPKRNGRRSAPYDKIATSIQCTHKN